MSDPKYAATVVCLNANQKELVDKARKMFMKEVGVDLSRSQMLAMLAARYIKTQGVR